MNVAELTTVEVLMLLAAAKIVIDHSSPNAYKLGVCAWMH